MDVLTLDDAARLLAARELSSRELVETCLRRADELDPLLGTFVTRCDDAALAAADEADRLFAAGTVRSPLQGVPLGIKDVLTTADMPTTGTEPRAARGVGARARRGFGRPPARGRRGARRQDHDDGARLRRARPGHGLPRAAQPVGARALVGRIELGHRKRRRRRAVPRRARHRHGRQHPPPVGVLRHHRPEADARPRPARRLHPARAVARPRRPDGALGPRLRAPARGADRHARRPAARRPRRRLAGGRAHAPRRRSEASIPAPPGRSSDAVATFESLGARITEIALPHYDAIVAATQVVMLREAYALHRANLRERWNDYGVHTRRRLMHGAFLTAADEERAQRVIENAHRAVAELLARHDAIVCLTAGGDPGARRRPRRREPPRRGEPDLHPHLEPARQPGPLDPGRSHVERHPGRRAARRPARRRPRPARPRRRISGGGHMPSSGTLVPCVTPLTDCGNGLTSVSFRASDPLDSAG